eukprot:gnl/Dysnectes_brevis/4291_a5694_1094.p1 GENE.gnl/Dysnectes_brevis/4291_a5694_1094~~gnl/Dysnectes_brevis/4291_a5694_1094.p1  ORF type:complete len:338 (+),score=26.82 gnl/Dysnectes_brevis/4291_a5694_1094:98-1111(+)
MSNLILKAIIIPVITLFVAFPVIRFTTPKVPTIKVIELTLFTSLILLVGLMTSAVRRTYTDASCFDMNQMLWHTLASIWNIFIFFLICKFLGFSKYQLGLSTLLSGCEQNRWKVRTRNVLTIVTSTHVLTPVVFYICGLLVSLAPGDFTGYTVPYIIMFYIVQLVCFTTNGISEELAQRGMMSAAWRTCGSRESLYILTGWNYAMLHSLNIEIRGNWGEYSMMVVNLMLEGAAWMFLFRRKGDLAQNIMLHIVDDLFSIWFGASTLAGYDIPLGTILGYTLVDNHTFLTGGEFGIGASPLYVFQTAVTAWLAVKLDGSSIDASSRDLLLADYEEDEY